MNTKLSHINKDWTIFLDRDGTINTLIKDHYISSWSEFTFIPGCLDAIAFFNKVFGRSIIVTNQQGIGKELMTHEELQILHQKMLYEINESGAYIDEIYYCPDLAIYNPSCRKPNPGMALKAKEDFPEINFSKSIMIGDEPSDIEFGNRLRMTTVKIGKQDKSIEANLRVDNLYDFYLLLNNEIDF